MCLDAKGIMSKFSQESTSQNDKPCYNYKSKACYLHVERKLQTMQEGLISKTNLQVLKPLKVPYCVQKRIPIYCTKSLSIMHKNQQVSLMNTFESGAK